LPDASGGAECDDAICASSIGGKTTDFSEGCRIGDDVIGGERDNYRITVALGGKCRASGNSRPGIASYRLEQDVGLNADFGQLLGDQKTILRVGYDDRAAEQARVRNPVQGILKGRTRTEQWQELFGRPSRDAGHSRVPAPPHMISGIIVEAKFVAAKLVPVPAIDSMVYFLRKTRPATASSFLTSLRSRACGAVISALSSARSDPIGHGSCARGKSRASRATKRAAFSALAMSTLIMSCTVTASWSGCQQSKSVTMATVA
jgi:hypothetical protein